MSNRNYIHVPKAFQLILYTDANSYGHYYLQGNPGEQPVGYNTIDRSTTVVIKPTNESRNFAVISEAGNISYEVDLHYVEELGENELRDLDDVQIVDILENDIIKWDGVNWVNAFNSGGGGANELDDLSDVEIGTLADKQSIMYNSGLDIWQNRLLVEADISDFGNYLTDITGEVLDDLDDVNIVAPSDGQVLKYNSGVWSNQSDSSFSGDYNDLTNKPSIPTQYTDELAQDATASMIKNGTGISWSYNDLSNTLTPTISLGAFTTANLSENTNLYYTDERVDDRVNSLFIDGTYISKTYNDGSNTFKVDLSATGTPDGTKFLRDDNTWAVPSGGSSSVILYPKHVTGRWYGSPGIFMQTSSTTDWTPSSTANVWFSMFIVTETTTYTDIGVVTGASGTGTILLGVYESDSGHQYPKGVPLKSQSVTFSANAANTSTFSSPLTLSPGVYWLAIMSSSTGLTFKRLTNTVSPHLGIATLSNANMSVAYFSYVYSTGGYSGSLPDLSSVILSDYGVTSDFAKIYLKAQ